MLFVDSASCELYHNSSEDALCYNYGSIGRDYVFINNNVDADELNRNMRSFLNTLNSRDVNGNFPPECVHMIFGLMCHNMFPLCDYNSNTPRPRQVCNTTHVLLLAIHEFVYFDVDLQVLL